MTNQDDRSMWPPALFANQLQQASENAAEKQLDMWEQMVSGTSGSKVDEFSKVESIGRETAIFKTRVQSGGRISIPDAEREVLDINEGDIVQTIVIPFKKQSTNDDE
ncbi:AbrB/MazE/SpoVT family DNA-binding domain-containing protein [Haladaptatus caseinilyticus]|uniref:AbrB/MazE/SpoVT family DNA-binding domain-containing protein n=1 Tax=Haladaptatus caseinilyticus TaxID=2993314 RepID=UPI00224A6132|nr:AbrB/MazE/SpoVT family DNA-binding domain-containing protein [Haladaptatus caseinilyticus]